MHHAKRNLIKLNLFSGSYMLLIILPIFVPFVLDKGLTMEQVFQLQGAFALSVLCCEIPSGYLADLWGRRRCLVLGGVFNGLGYSFLFLGTNFYDFLAYELLLGAAASLYSGADVALLYDSLESLDRSEQDKRHAVGNILASRSVAESFAAILNSLLMLLGSQLSVILLQLVVGWIPFTIAVSLSEVRASKPTHSHFRNFKYIARMMFIESKILRLISLVMIVWGMSTFYAVWLFQKYWLEENVPIEMFGWLWAAYNLCVAITSKLSHKIEKKIGGIGILILIAVLPISAYFSMACFSGFTGILFGLLFQVSRGLHQVSMKDALNSRIPSTFRATANSIISFGFRAVFLLTGPAIGWSVDRWGITFTLYALGLGFLVLALVIFPPFFREIRQSTV